MITMNQEDLGKFNIIKYISTLTSFALLLIITSCNPQVNSSRISTSSTSTTTDLKDPDFSSYTKNYLQNFNVDQTSILNIASNDSSSFNLRGKEIHYYIKEQTEQVNCLITHIIDTATTNRIIVMAALPRMVHDEKNSIKEYYYTMTPNDEAVNKAQCDKSAVNTILNSKYPGQSIVYAISKACPTCTAPTLNGDKVLIINQDGTEIPSSKVDLASVLINIGPAEQPTNIGGTCSEDSTCKASSYDCCLNRQCVNDKTIKTNVNQSSPEFLQAKADISANPANITKYTNFYYICPTSPTTDPNTDPNDIDEDKLLSERVKKLRELYYCTNPDAKDREAESVLTNYDEKSEVSICTVSCKDTTSATECLTKVDDLSFNSTYKGDPSSYDPGVVSLPDHSIVEIEFAGDTLYSDRKDATTPPGYQITFKNDVLTDPTKVVNVTHTPSSSDAEKTLKIKYKVNGSCKQINSTLAKCSKFYIQGQNKALETDHYPASQDFKVPFYADTGRSIRVEVNSTLQTENSKWTKFISGPSTYVRFTGGQVYDTQVVKLTFYVNLSSHNVMESKLAAIDEINNVCRCSGFNCALKPRKNDKNVVIDYICASPPNKPPLAKDEITVFLDSRSVPHRLFDTNGVSHEEASTEYDQEGKEFKYEDSEKIKPNSLSTYIGFNEIYGNFTTTAGSGLPAKSVPVKAGKTYDISVISEITQFSTCSTCGNDYYSNLMQIFPSLATTGGGYQPDPSSSDRSSSKINPEMKADDLVFGRACFVPATMIPWTHRAQSDFQAQRLSRLQTQHFLFANGYQRDWYGFDYGSLIGSFDGVLWFSVGSNRRIKAKTNKLFLAINAYFGDLTNDNTYTIKVTNTSALPPEVIVNSNDFTSTGAECQKYHICEIDQDCVAQLGWEYSCQRISGVTTKWPSFDKNASEEPNVNKIQNLLKMVGTSAAGPKRCVYRGRGAICNESYDSMTTNSSYNSQTYQGLHACNNNYYCQKLRDVTFNKKFNNKIVRYSRPMSFVNAKNGTSFHQFGLSTKILGRPFDYNGTEEVTSDVNASLASNNIRSVCIPGRNPEGSSTDFITQQSSTPLASYQGDQFSGIGMTPTGSLFKEEYLSSCSIFDDEGNFFQNYSGNSLKTMDDSELKQLAGTQAIPSNSIRIFESSDFSNNDNLIKNYDALQILLPTIQENRCLRAPGSTCHTDLDCAPSKLIVNNLTSIPTDNSKSALLNDYEIKFWKESLICSQKDDPSSSTFELKNNKCCRESGKTISIGTLRPSSGPQFNAQGVPGIDVSLNDPRRYSRVSTIYNEIKDNTVKALAVADEDECGTTCKNVTDLENQILAFELIAERTCCSRSWIRNFDKNNSNGGHAWGPTKMQTIDKGIFKCKNWARCGSTAQCPTQFSCEHTTNPNDPNCLAISTSNSDSELVFDFIGGLELLGVPQVTIKTSAYSESMCIVDPNDQETDGSLIPIPDTILTTGTAEYIDNSVGKELYSSTDLSNNFSSKLKKIFSEDEVTCCIQAGDNINSSDDNNLCCSGFSVDNGDEKTKRCALPDYSNVSLYFNKFISSIGKELNIPESLYDLKTGYINAQQLKSYICQKKICASNTIAAGVSLSNLKITGHENAKENVRRFIDGNDNANNKNGLADLYNAGLRWNTHLYCVPATISPNAGDTTLDITTCN